jgi:hypothetical protein
MVMRVAFCYSGMFRDFIDNVDNHKQHLLSHYNSDVYLHLWDVYGSYVGFNKLSDGNYAPNNTPLDYSENYISERHKNTIINKLKPIKYQFESYSSMAPIFKKRALAVDRDHSIPPSLNNMISMAYKIKQCGEMIDDLSQYDLVVKLRPDISFNDNISLNNSVPNTIFGNEYHSWQPDNVSDIFLYGDPYSMKCLNTLYYEIENIMESVNTWYYAPESLMYKHITNSGVNVVKHPINFKITRNDS